MTKIKPNNEIDPNEYDELIRSIREGLNETWGEVGGVINGVRDIIKSSAEDAKKAVNSAKNYKESNSNFQNLFKETGGMNFLPTQNSEGSAGKITNKMSNEFSTELQKMLLGYSDFSTSMKKIGAEMTEYLVKNAIDGIMKTIFAKQSAESVLGVAGSALGFGGGLFKTAGFIGNLFKHHDGGIIPSGANYSLPGSKEQLAMLKGGERVLSPAENTNYNNNSGNSPVVFNNFNVKAWDSKDVSKYLLENKQLLNAITFEGIKNNNGHLRTMVQNA